MVHMKCLSLVKFFEGLVRLPLQIQIRPLGLITRGLEEEDVELLARSLKLSFLFFGVARGVPLLESEWRSREEKGSEEE